jgi:uncharacterized protein YraI
MMRNRWFTLGRWAAIALVLIVALPLATTAAASPDLQTGVTATTTVNLRIRSGPDAGSAQVGLAPAGTTVPVLGRNEAANWIFVQYGDTMGWMAAWYTNISGDLNSVPVSGETGAAAPDETTGVMATTNVNLRIRSGPSTDYDQVGIAAQGSVVPVLSRTADNSWIYVAHAGKRGWMAAWYTTISGDLNAVPVAGQGEPLSPPATTQPAPTAEPTQQAASTAASTTTGVTAVTKNNLNIRQGPGLDNAVIGWAAAGSEVPVLGRNSASTWIYIEHNGKRGWMSAWYTLIRGNLSSVPVTSAAGEVVGEQPPAAATTAPAEATAAPAEATAAPSVSLPPSTGFALGGQSYTLAYPDLMRSAGMTWVKYQQKWVPGQDPQELAGRIADAHAKGFRVLISVPGLLYPSSIDYNAYTQYLAGVARLGADAIEVWNEMNLNREWPSGQVAPANYVNYMLRPAYQAIRAANPNTIVIAGALAPTGVNIPGDIMSDDQYLAGMQAAGAASYMDCLGVHHNAGATSPDAVTGHPAAPGGGHYSWYFDPTFNLYAGTFPSTSLCYTELGYLTGDGYPPIPSTFSWASNTTLSQHAQWLGRAVQKLRASGRVRMVIVFNVDFTTYTDDPQAGYAILRADGSCPACATLAAATQ